MGVDNDGQNPLYFDKEQMMPYSKLFLLDNQLSFSQEIQTDTYVVISTVVLLCKKTQRP